MNVENFIPLTGIAIAIYVIYYVMVQMQKNELKRYKKKLGNRVEVKNIIDTLRVDTCIEQVLIWESKNSDGLAKFGNKLKISVIEQSREQPFRDVYEDFQNMEIYGVAIEIIDEVQSKGSAARFVHEMEDCLFRRIYSEENALWVEWFSIGPTTEKTFLYASIATSNHESPYQLNQGGKIVIAKNKLRNRYKEMNDKPINRFFKSLYL